MRRRRRMSSKVGSPMVRSRPRILFPCRVAPDKSQGFLSSACLAPLRSPGCVDFDCCRRDETRWFSFACASASCPGRSSVPCIYVSWRQGRNTSTFSHMLRLSCMPAACACEFDNLLMYTVIRGSCRLEDAALAMSPSARSFRGPSGRLCIACLL